MRASFSAADDANPPTTSTPQQPSNLLQTGPGHSKSRQRVSNIFQILAQREISPWTKRSSKRLLGSAAAAKLDFSSPKCEAVRDARSGLISWIEAESLMHLSAKYCPLLPPPRSTIAAAFSPDGKTLASTHGDHTVKIIDCCTGSCLKVLSGHRRTPWVVRFHPLYPFILASGSLDHEVRLWNANTAECIASRDFYRPIASIAFHGQGELLAVASGHKLYIWHYNRRRETTSPSIILKTRRSLRAVHFHPHAAPFLLTAEVNDIDSSDSTMTLATSPGYLQYPPPIVYFSGLHSADHSTWSAGASVMSVPFVLWPSNGRESVRTQVPHTDENIVRRAEPSPSVRLLTYSTPSGQYELLLTPIETNTSSPMNEETRNTPPSNDMETEVSAATETLANMARHERVNRINPSGDSWELPFLQGWLMGQTGHRMTQSHDGISQETSSIEMRGSAPVTWPVVSSSVPQSRIRRSVSRHPSLHAHIPASASNDVAGFINTMLDASDPQPVISRVQPELATSLAAAVAAELPCTVKLRIWLHDVKNPCVPLDAERCRLAIPHVVLCSEMGAHFSPCGRFLAACVACVLPNLEADLGFQSQANHDLSGAGTSPTRHPISGHQVIYELRIYSLEEATFGMVLASRAVRAAHCLTSIQFSPTSEHLLLAYGRRHHSLLKSIVIDGETTMPIYTILEVYRVSDMELIRVLPGAEDEVNVACFHPSVGGGLVYGTKEGKLRIFHYDRSQAMSQSTFSSLDENTIEDKDEKAVYTPPWMLIDTELVGIYCNYIDLFRRPKGMQA